MGVAGKTTRQPGRQAGSTIRRTGRQGCPADKRYDATGRRYDPTGGSKGRQHAIAASPGGREPLGEQAPLDEDEQAAVGGEGRPKAHARPGDERTRQSVWVTELRPLFAGRYGINYTGPDV